MDKLIEKVEKIAKERFDGHYSIFSFTTNYKGCFGTIEYGEDYMLMEDHDTLESLLEAMIANPDEYDLSRFDDKSEYCECDGECESDGGLQWLYNDFKEIMGDIPSGNAYLGEGMYVDRNGNITSEQY